VFYLLLLFNQKKEKDTSEEEYSDSEDIVMGKKGLYFF
jgi:hypothetical protein